MKINPVSYMTQNPNNHSFKGLWGPKVFLGTEENSLMECDYYVMKYYPFADETTKEINETIKRKLEPMNEIKKEDLALTMPDWIVKCQNTSAKIMRRLSITKADYKKMFEGEMPEGLIKLENAAANTKLIKNKLQKLSKLL